MKKFPIQYELQNEEGEIVSYINCHVLPRIGETILLNDCSAEYLVQVILHHASTIGREGTYNITVWCLEIK